MGCVNCPWGVHRVHRGGVCFQCRVHRGGVVPSIHPNIPKIRKKLLLCKYGQHEVLVQYIYLFLLLHSYWVFTYTSVIKVEVCESFWQGISLDWQRSLDIVKAVNQNVFTAGQLWWRSHTLRLGCVSIPAAAAAPFANTSGLLSKPWLCLGGWVGVCVWVCVFVRMHPYM